MVKITLKNNPITISGELPQVGESAINFSLIGKDLKSVSLQDFEGQRLILNIFPSIDTGVCAKSVRAFNKQAAKIENTKILCISRDLPFAQKRFCGAEGIENVITLSDFVNGAFGNDYGLTITSGVLSNLHSRCVIVLNKTHKVIYVEQVTEISNEPNYKSALAVLQ